MIKIRSIEENRIIDPILYEDIPLDQHKCENCLHESDIGLLCITCKHAPHNEDNWKPKPKICFRCGKSGKFKHDGCEGEFYVCDEHEKEYQEITKLD